MAEWECYTTSSIYRGMLVFSGGVVCVGRAKTRGRPKLWRLPPKDRYFFDVRQEKALAGARRKKNPPTRR